MLTIDATMRARYWTTVRNEGRCTRRIANLADVILAVSDIYYHKTVLWGHAREGRGQHALTDKSPERANVDALLSEIGHRIWEYFNGGPNTANTQENFDEFHSDLCDYFLSKINAIREKVGYAPMSYGQAQKLINLTFKYLTCYADYETYADLFHYSHMVIDSNVLGSFSKSKLSALLGTPVTSVIKISNHSWTSFSKSDYLNIVSEYRRVIGPYIGGKSYMHLEYCIWHRAGAPVTSFASSGGSPAAPIAGFHK